MSLDMISGSKQEWCPFCKNKTELKLYNWLKKLFVTDAQIRFDWCKNPETNSYLPFDFVLCEYKIIIELDGRQHFEQVSNWESPEEQRLRDIYKMDCAIVQGYTIIRLLQDDVWRDKNNWQEKLLQHIKIRELPEKIFIANDDVYINHKQ
jgi:very-short-patch-repair endonuclease